MTNDKAATTDSKPKAEPTKRKTLERLKTFSNVEVVFQKMLELGFFYNERQMQEELARITEVTPSSHASNEFWYSNHVVELKIFRGLFGAYEICNYRGLMSHYLDQIFEVAELPRHTAK